MLTAVSGTQRPCASSPARVPPSLNSARSPSRDTAPARSPASPEAASAPSGSSSPAPGSAARPRSRTAAPTRTGSASNTSTASAASRTSPPRPAPPEDLAAAARQAGLRVRHGINGRPHPLAALGGPGAFPPDVWNVFTHPGAEQRIRRLLTLPGQPGLNAAARQLGIRNANLASQVRQLESVVGTPLLRTLPDGRLTLTAYGERFARDVTPVLKMLAPP
ncbi:MAG: LysR family transcriptional regulator [Streptosporangiaceae bacterium]